jgi:hypothetical protein
MPEALQIITRLRELAGRGHPACTGYRLLLGGQTLPTTGPRSPLPRRLGRRLSLPGNRRAGGRAETPVAAGRRWRLLFTGTELPPPLAS